MSVAQRGPWPPPCQQEPFPASAMSRLGRAQVAAPLAALLASQVSLTIHNLSQLTETCYQALLLSLYRAIHHRPH